MKPIFPIFIVLVGDTYIQKVVLNEGQNNLNLLVPLTRQPHRKEDAILVSHSFYFILFIMLPIVCCRKENQNLQRKDHLVIYFRELRNNNYTNHQGLKSKVGA